MSLLNLVKRLVIVIIKDVNQCCLQMTDEEKLAYYEEAMKRGLESRLIPKFFTTIGKMKVNCHSEKCLQ